MMQPYFPNDKPSQADWYTNMANNFPSVSAILGFSSVETDSWVGDCNFAAYLLGPMTAPFDAFSTALTGYVHTLIAGTGSLTFVNPPAIPAWANPSPGPVAPGIDGRRQKTVDRLKASHVYTPLVIGHLLRTENTGAPFNPATAQGLIRSARENGQGQVIVAFSKLGGMIDGVNLYLARPAHADMKVGQFTHTPAVDTTPLLVPGTPEERTYTVQPVIKDAEIGLRSPAVSVLVK